MTYQIDNIELMDPIYSVYIRWNPFNSKHFKAYCAESLCNLFGFNASLSVKIVYEAIELKRALVYSCGDVKQAVEIRNQLLALGINSIISKSSFKEKV
jgi:hypothetical protein